MEPFTAKVVKSLPKRVQVVTLQDTRGLKLYQRRTGATFEDEHDHGPGDDHDHDHDSIDGHAWLDPVNAKMMVDRIAQVLSAKEPANAALFRANADALKAKLDALSAELAADLTPIAGKPYIVFHDALQYFERRFRLRVVGSIAISPEMAPSAKRLSTLRKRIASLGARVRLRRAAVRHAARRHGDRGHQGEHRHHRPRGRQDRARPRALFHAAAQPGARPQGLPRPAGLTRVRAARHATRPATAGRPDLVRAPIMRKERPYTTR